MRMHLTAEKLDDGRIAIVFCAPKSLACMMMLLLSLQLSLLIGVE